MWALNPFTFVASLTFLDLIFKRSVVHFYTEFYFFYFYHSFVESLLCPYFLRSFSPAAKYY